MNSLILRLLLRRLVLALVSLWAISIVVFAITAILPGDAAQAQLGQDATPEAVAALREQMGLNVPAPARYMHWLGGLVHGDLGTSMTTSQPVGELIGSRLPNSLLLAGMTALFSVPIALSLGIAAAVWRGSLFDRGISTVAVALTSVPEFLVATMAVLVFAVHLHWFPALSYLSTVESIGQFLKVFALPVMTLCCVICAQMLRMTRAAVIDQLDAPFIEMVRLKGASPVRLVLAHALPNAIGPIANAVALSLSYLLGGVIIVETVFDYPGVAKLMVDGVSQRDLPLIQACAMLFCAGYLVLVTAADLCGIVSNPRLRHR